MSITDGNPRLRELLDSQDMSAALQEPLRRPPNRLHELLSRSGGGRGGDAAFAGTTLGEFLYDYIRIAPVVVEAVDFSRAQDIDTILEFGVWARAVSGYDGVRRTGLLSGLSGYVSERMVAAHMQALGHVVEFPATPNQPGWDLLIDGREFQVKNLADASDVHEHLHRYPYPVIVNRELAGALGAEDRVYVDPELSHEGVRQTTARALERGEDLSDFEIPWISLGVSALGEARRLVLRQTDLGAAAVRAATNTAARTVGGYTGSMSMAVAMGLVFGPAGGIVGGLLGAVAGGIAGRRAARRLRTWAMTGRERQQVAGAVTDVCAEAGAASELSVAATDSKRASVESHLSGAGTREALREYVLQRMEDERTYLKARLAEIGQLGTQERADPVERANRLLLLLARAHVHPDVVRGAMARLKDALSRLCDKEGRVT